MSCFCHKMRIFSEAAFPIANDSVVHRIEYFPLVLLEVLSVAFSSREEVSERFPGEVVVRETFEASCYVN